MKRGLVLGALMTTGALSLGVTAYQQPPAGPNVVAIDKIKENLYVLKGGGGNTAAFITANGVVVVDTKLAGWGQPILDKIKTVTNKPVTTIINTHTHGDHNGSNEFFGTTVEIIAQDNTKANMMKMDAFKGDKSKFLPKKTFKDKMSFGTGADQVDLYYFGPGHTNGDAWVVFPALRTMHAGDMFAGKSVPNVDGDNGGSVLHYSETLMKAYNGIKNVDTIINGHSPATTTRADLKEYADFTKDFLKWAQAELKAGKTPEQAAAEWKVPEKYKGYSPTVSAIFGGLPGRIQRLSDEMTKKK
jgi:glyoxylase-like metal-dependent hydrolase (beta-lactamase superfamily II)